LINPFLVGTTLHAMDRLGLLILNAYYGHAIAKHGNDLLAKGNNNLLVSNTQVIFHDTRGNTKKSRQALFWQEPRSSDFGASILPGTDRGRTV
jgi:hypothetical protein